MQVMVYLEVLVSDNTYHGTDSLTYHFERQLPVGSLVSVSLRAKQVYGLVVSTSTTKPTFPTKAIIDAPDIPPLPQQLLQLLDWMRSYYPAPLGTLVQHFLPRKLPKKELPPFSDFPPLPAQPSLTDDQSQVLSQIGPSGLHILHGGTGTGKTRVYLELTQRAMHQHKSVIILTPEIGNLPAGENISGTIR